MKNHLQLMDEKIPVKLIRIKLLKKELNICKNLEILIP